MDTPLNNNSMIYVNKFIFLLQLNCLLHHQFHQNASTSKLKQHKEETLPESIYSGAMIFPVSGPWSRLSQARACFLFCIPLLNYVLVLAGCLFVQFTFVIYVNKSMSNTMLSSSCCISCGNCSSPRSTRNVPLQLIHVCKHFFTT